MILNLDKQQQNWLYKLLKFHDKHQSICIDNIEISNEDEALRNWFRKILNSLEEEKEKPTEVSL